ncbi:family 1 glycosylhydrolase [Nonomuraea sp. PA05]|uniref:family 1 glycosylhydrolase n=1 Tax=Nonomuraea sp. PA05 TaxID=2604466 RepID=UPI0011D334D8|nr:family 1 glycosylhydrolase [Nonomuraea sp. PA05]TYB71321.1 family 1 glycosylhydrolase [Nonomuraea sp. PA05]
MKWYETGELHFALGIEDTFVPQPAPGARPIDEYELTQHYDRWHDDLALAAEAGATQIRWGVPWHRVQPEPGRWDWSWLDRVVARFGELGLTPIVDLMHYGTPLWLDGQFAAPDYPLRVAEYGAAVAERYRDRLSIFTPMNEPLLTARFCGLSGYWPPYLTGDDGFVRLLNALAAGIVRTQHAIAEVSPEASFVHVEVSARYESDTESEELEWLRHSAYAVEDLVTGRVDAAHPLAGYLAAHGMTDDDLAFFLSRPAVPDVMGVNYYPQHSTERYLPGMSRHGRPFEPRPPVNGWTGGLAEVLTGFAERYGRPVHLTETAWTGTLAERAAWLDASVACVRELRAGGLDLVGYTWWPVFDMVEWTYREGDGAPMDYRLPMGLWRLEEQPDGALARIRTPLAERFLTHTKGVTSC